MRLAEDAIRRSGFLNPEDRRQHAAVHRTLGHERQPLEILARPVQPLLDVLGLHLPLLGAEASRAAQVDDDGVGLVAVAILAQFVQVGLHLRVRLAFREGNLEQRPPGAIHHHTTHRGQCRTRTARHQAQVDVEWVEVGNFVPDERMLVPRSATRQHEPVVDGLKVRILGAGIAGLSCALALRDRASVSDIRVLERDSSEKLPQRLGHGLLLMQNGVRALEALRLEHVLERCSPISRALFRDPHGVVVRVDALEDVYSVTRQALIAALREELPAGCLRLDARVRSVRIAPTQSGNGRRAVALELSDGHMESLDGVDLLVGAEGVNSPLFRALNPGVERQPSRVKEVVTSSELPELAAQLEGTFIKTQFPDQGLAFGLLAPTKERVIGYLQFDSERYEAPGRGATPDDFRQFLGELLKDAPEPIGQYLRQADLNTAHVWHPVNADIPDQLACDNAVLIGDAAHPVLPFTSQGVSAALEDAIMLADAVRALEQPKSQLSVAVQGFCEDRRRDVGAYVSGGRRILHSFLDTSRGFTLPYVDGAASTLERHLQLPPGSLRQLIAVLDTDGDGYLDRREFDLALALFGLELEPEVISKLFREIDTEHDGLLSVEELLVALGTREPKGSEQLENVRERLASPRRISRLALRGRLALVFRQLDGNRDGKLDFDEFRAATLSLGLLYDEAQARRAFSQLDHDADGGISFDELFDSLEAPPPSTAVTFTEHLRKATSTSAARPLFDDHQVDLGLLRERAFNFRWATLPQDTIPLTAADPDFPVAREIREALEEYLAGGYLCYGPAGGLPSFRESTARHYQERRGVPCLPGQVLATDSAASAMYLVAHAVLQPGDEALIPDPVDFLFERSVLAAGGVVRRYRLDPARGYAFDVDEIRSLITPRTRLLSVCNPHNPTGRVWSRAEVEALAQLALEHDLSIMSDEVWADIVYAPNELCSIASLAPEIARRTFTVYGFSKGYGLAGLRLGVLLCPDEASAERVLHQSHADETAYGVSTLSQIAGQAALERASGWLEDFIAHLTTQRDYAVERLRQIPGLSCHAPQGTYVVFPKIVGSDADTTELTTMLAERYKIAVVPGSPRFFGPGAAGHLRLSIATSRAILKHGIDRLEAGLGELLG